MLTLNAKGSNIFKIILCNLSLSVECESQTANHQLNHRLDSIGDRLVSDMSNYDFTEYLM